ncbi:Rv1733c family protein [Gordonia sp. NPDC003424]
MRGYQPWSRNPLMRRGDRVRATASLAAILLALLAVPVCIVVSMGTYSSVTNRVDQAVAVTAHVDSVAATATPSPARGAVVSWNRQGTRHTGSTVVPNATKAGDSIQVWLDRNGTLVPEPAGMFERLLTAAWAGLLCWMGAIAVTLAGVGLVHRRVAKRHAALWDLEWTEASQTNGWASH